MACIGTLRRVRFGRLGCATMTTGRQLYSEATDSFLCNNRLLHVAFIVTVLLEDWSLVRVLVTTNR